METVQQQFESLRLVIRKIEYRIIRSKGFWYALILFLAGVAMLWFSWGKWPDVLIDFGRELYIPWLLSEGKVLYKDLFYFNGPLSPHWNAFHFKLFGAYFSTLLFVNIGLLILLITIMYRVLRYASSDTAALLACLVFIFLFAFNQYTVGSFNYICPYSHEATHGMLLSWITIAFHFSHYKSNKLYWLAAAGISLGTIFLTKPEFFLAAASASFSAIVLWTWQKKPSKSVLIKLYSIFIFSILIPILLAFAWLFKHLSIEETFIGLLGSWWHLLNSEVAGGYFYRSLIGLDDLLGNIGKLALAAGMYFLIFFSAITLAFRKKKKTKVLILAAISFILFYFLIWLKIKELPIGEVARPFPLFMGALAIWNLSLLHKSGHEKYFYGFILSVFSFFMLSKMLLNATIWHYGFVLTMPSMMVLVILSSDWIPSIITKNGGKKLIFNVIILTILFGLVGLHIKHSWIFYENKSIFTGKEKDAFGADSRDENFYKALSWIESHTQKDETVGIFPDGSIINFLARRRNSIPLISFLPPEIEMLGEDNILRDLKLKPPNYIIITSRKLIEYNLISFGTDYCQETMNWIIDNYFPLKLIASHINTNEPHQFFLIYKYGSYPN